MNMPGHTADVRYVVAITGASGCMYGIRLLQNLPGEKILVISKMAERIIPHETGMSVEEVRSMADVVFDDDDLFASISSGSYRFDAMIVAPCSASSLGKISNGLADTLITRAAAVAMKESRKLVLVVRETPKSAILLENELRLARCGVCILFQASDRGRYHRFRGRQMSGSAFDRARPLPQVGMNYNRISHSA